MENSTTAPPSLSLPTSTNPQRSPEIDLSEPPTTRIHPIHRPTLSNGVLKRHLPHHLHPSPPTSATATVAVPVTYKECMKNHAAARGGHALDGCGEFMPTSTAVASNPASLICAACGCHRNFHRLVPPGAAVERYHPHPPPTHGGGSPNSESPPPISSSYYPRHTPHMLLSLGGGNGGSNHCAGAGRPLFQQSRKRFRTKFSPDQKGKMFEFAEKIGWKMQKIDEEMMAEFCNEVGVERGVFKVWMHNNKNTLGKKDLNGIPGGSSVIAHHGLNTSTDNKENNESSDNNGNNVNLGDSINGVEANGSESSA